MCGLRCAFPLSFLMPLLQSWQELYLTLFSDTQFQKTRFLTIGLLSVANALYSIEDTLIAEIVALTLVVQQKKYFGRYSINHQYFDGGLVSDQHAWIWGFFLTDGCISTMKFSGRREALRWNQRYDCYPLLHIIANTLESNAPVYVGSQINRLNGKTYHHSVLNLCSVKLTTAMSALLDCNPDRKTFEVTFPFHIDSQFAPGLVRGIIDGDGCWNFSRGVIRLIITSANLTFLKELRAAINSNCIKEESSGRISSQSSRLHYLKYYRQDHCLMIADWIYQPHLLSSGLYVPKKYERCRLYKTMIEKKSSKSDRVRGIQEHLLEEKENDEMLLSQLVSMSKGHKESPFYLRFRVSFLKHN